MTDFIAKQLEANLGIKVKIENVDIGTYVSRAIEVPTKQWELFVASESSAKAIPDYNSLTHYIPKGYGGNTWMFKEDSPNPDVAKLAKEMTRLNDLASAALKAEDRKAKLVDLQKFAMTNFAPWLSMPEASIFYSIVRKNLRNYPHADAANDFQMRVPDLWSAKA
jgi:ABC-type transport system substrate-binding protein